MKKYAILSILMSGILWGCMGLFVRTLGGVGLTSMDIVFLRAVVTAAVMILFLLIYDRKKLIIKLKDIWCFLGTGIASITFFNYCYFKCMTVASLSVAAVLLYTAPAIVMVLSYFLFRERFSVKKAISLVMTFAGCVLVTGVLGGDGVINAKGVLYGLGAGLGYALYSIFSRYALERGYNTFTITCYTFIVSALATTFFTDVHRVIGVACMDERLVALSVALGIVCTVAPYILYTLGLSHVENGQASIIASIEPVTASVIGVVVFDEKMTVQGVIGMVLVIVALVICNMRTNKRCSGE